VHCEGNSAVPIRRQCLIRRSAKSRTEEPLGLSLKADGVSLEQRSQERKKHKKARTFPKTREVGPGTTERKPWEILGNLGPLVVTPQNQPRRERGDQGSRPSCVNDRCQDHRHREKGGSSSFQFQFLSASVSVPAGLRFSVFEALILPPCLASAGGQRRAKGASLEIARDWVHQRHRGFPPAL